MPDERRHFHQPLILHDPGIEELFALLCQPRRPPYLPPPPFAQSERECGGEALSTVGHHGNAGVDYAMILLALIILSQLGLICSLPGPRLLPAMIQHKASRTVSHLSCQLYRLHIALLPATELWLPCINDSLLIYLLIHLAQLRIETRASQVLGKHYSIELYDPSPSPTLIFLFIYNFQRFSYLFYVHMCLLECMYVYHHMPALLIEARRPWMPGTEVTDRCEPLDMRARN